MHAFPCCGHAIQRRHWISERKNRAKSLPFVSRSQGRKMVLKGLNVCVVVLVILCFGNIAPAFSSAEEQCKESEYYSTVSDSCQHCPEAKSGCTTRRNPVTYRNCLRCFAVASTSQPTVITTEVRDENHVDEEKSGEERGKTYSGEIKLVFVILGVGVLMIAVSTVALLAIVKFKFANCFANKWYNCQRGQVQETRVLMNEAQGNICVEQQPLSSHMVEETSPMAAHLLRNLPPTDELERKIHEDSSRNHQRPISLI